MKPLWGALVGAAWGMLMLLCHWAGGQEGVSWFILVSFCAGGGFVLGMLADL